MKKDVKDIIEWGVLLVLFSAVCIAYILRRDSLFWIVMTLFGVLNSARYLCKSIKRKHEHDVSSVEKQ